MNVDAKTGQVLLQNPLPGHVGTLGQKTLELPGQWHFDSAMIKSIQKIMAPLPLKKLAKAERSLERVEKLVELFEPFILQNEHDFVADNVEKLSWALVDEEKQDFGYDTRSIDWWDYWINIHIPALRKWTYPLIEGRPLEARPARSFDLGAANGEAVKTGTNGATWRYS